MIIDIQISDFKIHAMLNDGSEVLREVDWENVRKELGHPECVEEEYIDFSQYYGMRYEKRPWTPWDLSEQELIEVFKKTRKWT